MRIDKALCTLRNIQDRGKISYIHLEGKTVYNPEKMTVKELKMVLKDLKLLRGGEKGTKTKDVQKCFQRG